MEGTCEHSEVCGRDALDGHDGKCILHSENLDKDWEAFKEALEEHRDEHQGDFRHVFFSGPIDFSNETFGIESLFFRATFKARARFYDAEFFGRASFVGAAFEARADFEDVTFHRGADFEAATFLAVNFRDATFGAVDEEETNFQHATFEEADFRDSTFENEAVFDRSFETREDVQIAGAMFSGCEFRDDVLLCGGSEENRAFAGGKVDFEDVTVAPDASLHFRYADLSQCRLLRTDLRDVEFTGVKWCEDVSSDGRYFNEWFRRVGIYDEIYEQNQEGSSEEAGADGEEKSDSESVPSWSEIERLYRQLKRNYEDRGDFPRAGDFHMGEKVARRQISQTQWDAQVLLYAYRALSKYGERALPAALWLATLVPAFALLYYALGATTCLSCESLSYPDAFLSSLEATFYPVRPVGFQDFWPQFSSIVQRVISPVLIALLALALRQRVKR
jgi:uncharacterized protein YjbI with pentapeptide repeats